MYQAKFEARFVYNPLFWPIWLGFGFLWLLHWLPINLRYKTGSLIGLAMYALAQKRKKLVEANLKFAFTDTPDSELKQLSREHFKQLGISLIETTVIWWGHYRKAPTNGRENAWVKYDGLPHLEQAIESNKGVLLVIPHFTTLEMFGLFTGMQTHYNAVYRPHDNPLMDYLIAKTRSLVTKTGQKATPIANNNTRQMLKVLRKGEALILLPDQRYRSRGHVKVPFFGEIAKSNPATSKIAKLTGCSVILCDIERVDAHQYKVVYSKPLNDFPTDSPEQDTERLHAFYQDSIMRHPSQYLWSHNRWDLKWDKEKKAYIKKA